MTHEDFDNETPSRNEGPPISRGMLWEAVLQQSLESGDPERIEAAIELADSGGASTESLDRARSALRSAAEKGLEEALANARASATGENVGGDKSEENAAVAAALAAATTRVECMCDHSPGQTVVAARRELWRLAQATLERALAADSADVLRKAIVNAEGAFDRLDPSAAAADGRGVKLANARQQLRLMRDEERKSSGQLRRSTTGEVSDSTAASAGGSCFSANSSSSYISDAPPSNWRSSDAYSVSSVLPVPAATDHVMIGVGNSSTSSSQAMSSSSGARRGQSPGCIRASLPPGRSSTLPTRVGRSNSGELLEAGLAQPSAMSQKVASRSDQECTLS